MAGGESILKLGPVFLNYCEFSWPRYRGLQPVPVEIHQPAERWGEIAGYLSTLNGGPATITVGGPNRAGSRPGDDEVVIGGVYIHHADADDLTCSITAYDARWRLLRFINDADFNIQFGDGLLEGTEAPFYKDAVKRIINRTPAIKELFAPDALDRIPAMRCPNWQRISGLPSLVALPLLCEEGGFDITNRADGLLTFSNRVDAPNQYLPGPDAYDFQTTPGWHAGRSITLGRPKVFRVYSTERHCLRLVNDDPTATTSGSLARELRVQLEQVYVSEGQVYTLEELLEAHDFAPTDLTDAQIAATIMTPTLQGTVIDDFSRTDDGKKVLDAVKDGWRQLWRIQYPDALGKWGAWTDFIFGKILSDGSASSVAVECPWVELYVVHEADNDDSTTANADLSKNHASPSPFQPTWEFDEAAGIIRLQVDRSQLRNRQNLAIPGALIEPLRIKAQAVVGDGEGENISLPNYRIIESEDPAKAQFDANFEIAIYLCATKRLPNNDTRFHMEQTPGYADGDIAWVEIGPGEVLAVRDYVEPGDAEHPALSDGLGRLLNKAELEDDAARRAQQWQVLYGMRRYEPVVAEGLQMFRDLDLNGPINSISLDLTLEGPGGDVQAMRSRLLVGELSDPRAIDERKRMRSANRRYSARGRDVT